MNNNKEGVNEQVADVQKEVKDEKDLEVKDSVNELETDNEDSEDDLTNGVEDINEDDDNEGEEFKSQDASNSDEETDNETDDLFESFKKDISEPKKPDKPVQSNEENSKYAAARRKAEAEAKVLKEKLRKYEEAEAEKKQLSEEEIDDKAFELGISKEEYREQLEEKNFIKELKKERERKKLEEQADLKKKEALNADLQEFNESYPDYDVKKVLNDEEFKLFASGKLGVQSLSKVLTDFKELKSKIKNRTYSSVASKNNRSTVNASSKNTYKVTEIQRKEIDAFNKANPYMKMTEDEWMSYERTK